MNEKERKYMTTAEAAELWGFKPETVAEYCQNDRIPGVMKSGGRWQIPCDAIRPLSIIKIRQILRFMAYIQASDPLYTCFAEECLQAQLEFSLRYLADCGYIEITEDEPSLRNCIITAKGVEIISKTTATGKKLTPSKKKEMYEKFKSGVELLAGFAGIVSDVITIVTSI